MYLTKYIQKTSKMWVFVLAGAVTASTATKTYTLTYFYSLTHSQSYDKGEPVEVKYATKVYQKVALPVDGFVDPRDKLLEKKSLSWFFNPFLLIGVSLLIIIIIGSIYSKCCRKIKSIPNPNYIKPKFVVMLLNEIRQRQLKMLGEPEGLVKIKRQNPNKHRTKTVRKRRGSTDPTDIL